MTLIHIGEDYAGVQCVKMTKDGYDPATTLDSVRGAFLFNSKWAADVKFNFRRTVPYSYDWTLSPSGSSLSNFTWAGERGWQYYRHRGEPELYYDLPLMDFKHRRLSNGRYIGDSYSYVDAYGYQERGAKIATGGAFDHGWVKNLTLNATNISLSIASGFYIHQNGSTGPSVDDIGRVTKQVSVWRLPGDETNILHGSPQSPVPGMDSLLISSSALKIAKPGFNVNTATATQLAIDTGNIPAKIIAADDISLPVGTTSYNCGFSLPNDCVVEVHYYRGSTIYYPASPDEVPFGADYYVSGQNLIFVNSLRSCRARFMVIAVDGSSRTTGNNDVIRQFTSGGKDVVQFLKPGASSSPSFSDIALDSRWPCIQILATGVLSVSNGDRTHSVSFNGTGMFPMVKYMTIHGAGSQNGVGSWQKRVRQPVTTLHFIDRANTAHTPTESGDCTYCRLTANNATFYTFRGRPSLVYYEDFEDYDYDRVKTEAVSNPLYAIRYYIFGIAK